MIKWIRSGRTKFKLLHAKQKLIVIALMVIVGMTLAQIIKFIGLQPYTVLHSAMIGAFLGLAIGLTGRIAIERMSKSTKTNQPQKAM